MERVRTVSLVVADGSILDHLFPAILDRLLKEKGKIRYEQLGVESPGKQIYWVYGLHQEVSDYFVSITLGPHGTLSFLDHYLMEIEPANESGSSGFKGIPMHEEEIQHWCSFFAEVIMDESLKQNGTRLPPSLLH